MPWAVYLLRVSLSFCPPHLSPCFLINGLLCVSCPFPYFHPSTSAVPIFPLFHFPSIPSSSSASLLSLNFQISLSVFLRIHGHCYSLACASSNQETSDLQRIKENELLYCHNIGFYPLGWCVAGLIFNSGSYQKGSQTLYKDLRFEEKVLCGTKTLNVLKINIKSF